MHQIDPGVLAPSKSEAGRLARLSSLGILDMEPEASFDRITRLARLISGAAVAHVSLIDDHRQWIKSAAGSSLGEISLDDAVCAWTICQEEPLIVGDLLADERFCHLPCVADEPRHRFYAGVQLRDSHGFVLGVLCCLDPLPRTLTRDQVAGLEDLARLVIDAVELRMLATIDTLTGLPTRRQFIESAERAHEVALGRRGRLACLVLDVDDLRSVNELQGHAAGDRVLQRLGALCRKEVRSSDSFGRLGGDEFCIVVEGTAAAALDLAERLRKELGRSSFKSADASFHATVSVGVGVCSMGPDASCIDALIDDAFSALREAKKSGGDRSRASADACARPGEETRHVHIAEGKIVALASKSAPDALDNGPGSVVLIEDDLTLSLALADELELLGYATIEIHQMSSLRTTDISQASFVILDVSLAGADAVDVLQLLQLKGYRGPIQIVSAHRRDVLEEVKSLGERKGMRMLPVLQKPIELAQVCSLVESFHSETSDARVPSTPIVPAEAGSGIRGGPSQAVTLRQALQNGWMDIWYQPKYFIATGTLAGVECLSRVNHPDLGLLPPSAFLPGADLTELGDLTELVVARACADWSDFGSFFNPPRMAVNVPGALLLDLPLVQLLREHAPSDRAWPGLIFEVTEDDALRDLVRARDVGTQLRIYGVDLSIDDFGLGYSSLARLKEIPFREIKLDRSLVDGCATDAINGSLCRSVIELAHSFSASVVAEGVERSEDLDFLRLAGCDMAQGFLLKRPMSKEKLLVELARMDRNSRFGAVAE